MIIVVSKLTDKHSTDDILIAVMGMTGARKTKFVTDCTEEPTEDESHSLELCEYTTKHGIYYGVQA